MRAYAIGKDTIALEFDSTAQRDSFVRSISGMQGIISLSYKENTRRLRLQYEPSSAIGMLIDMLKGKPVYIQKEDVHFYVAPLIKHPGVKLLFSMLMLGGTVGLISFGVCSLFLIPYLKTKF